MKTIELVEWLCSHCTTHLVYDKSAKEVVGKWHIITDMPNDWDKGEMTLYDSKQIIELYKESTAKPIHIPNTDIVINWDQKYVSVSKDDILTAESLGFVAENKLSIQTNLL